MSTDSIGGAHQAQQAHYVRELQETQTREQVAAGSLGAGNSISYFQSGIQPTGADGRVVPIAAPVSGSAAFPIDVSELDALLQGLQAESEETIQKANEQAILADREKTTSARDQRVKELETQLDPSNNEKTEKCATAKIVLGSLLFPAGALLIADGVKDKKAVQAADSTRSQLLETHYGEGLDQVKGFEKAYAEDSVENDPAGTRKHLAQLGELKSNGVIDDDLYQDLSQLVVGGASPDAVGDRIFNDAVQGYVDAGENTDQLDGQNANRELSSSSDEDSGIRSAESDLAKANNAAQQSDGDFQQFLAWMTLKMEEEKEGINEVIENLQNGNTAALEGAKNKRDTQGQIKTTI